MAKKTAGSYEGTIYGIDRRGEVAYISVYRKGSSVRMSRMWPDGRTYSHDITLPGRTARSEAVVVFGLHEIFEVSHALESAESTKQKLKELEDKAAKEKLAATADAKEAKNDG